MRLSQSHDSGHGFGWLTRVDPSHFYVLFLTNFFISISSFNIELIER